MEILWPRSDGTVGSWDVGGISCSWYGLTKYSVSDYTEVYPVVRIAGRYYFTPPHLGDGSRRVLGSSNQVGKELSCNRCMQQINCLSNNEPSECTDADLTEAHEGYATFQEAMDAYKELAVVQPVC